MSRREGRLALAGAGVFGVAAAGVAILALIADRPTPADVRLARLALPAAIAVPAVLGLVARRSRPSLLVAGAILGAAMSTLSFVLLPLLIPAALYVKAAAGKGWTGPAPPRRAAVAAVFTVVLGLAALGSAGFVRAERCWSWTVSADGATMLRDGPPAGSVGEELAGSGESRGSRCGEEVTPAGAAAGLALAMAAVGGGVLLSRPT
ncbi:MAG TPA: hypothetical protein VML96_08140 [Egibacteraceae bacterium]|nr:hypothetical protein [Egibacteraceae bacterium]